LAAKVRFGTPLPTNGGATNDSFLTLLRRLARGLRTAASGQEEPFQNATLNDVELSRSRAVIRMAALARLRCSGCPEDRSSKLFSSDLVPSGRCI